MSNCRAAADADAVRYIVLRKLASGLRHTLMGELQSIQFLAELGARNIDNGADQSEDARLHRQDFAGDRARRSPRVIR